MIPTFATRLYWPGWLVATVLTGLVAGFMLGHALILGRFVEYLLTSGTALGLQYAAFRATAGRGGLAVFYVVCGLQVLAVFGFLTLAVLARRARGVATLAAVAGVLWVIVHYASGFGTLEARVTRATGAVDPAVVAEFLKLNIPIHVFHAATLITALGALLSLPLSALRRKD